MDAFTEWQTRFEDKKVCAVTGHRPKKLAKLNIEYEDLCKNIKNRLRIAFAEAIEAGYTVFLCGMALGVDLWAAQQLLELQKYRDIELYAIIPFEGQQDIWPDYEQLEYIRVLRTCNGVYTVCSAPSKEAYLERDKVLVGLSSRMIAVYGEKISGGTKYTLELAKKNGLDIEIISV